MSLTLNAPSTKHWRAALSLGLCLLGTPLAAGESVPYRLGAQDRLRIHVYEWPALTGEFTVGADGMLSLPLIGEFSVSGLQTADLGQEISTRLKSRAGLSEPPNTAVGIAQYRPYYIIGSVERSGEYAYRPGMLVLNAVSIAGGAYRRTDVSSWSVMHERLKAEGDLPILAQKRRELVAREARLKAEIAVLEKQGNAASAPEGNAATASGLTGNEQAMFGAQRSHQQNELRALQQTIVLNNDEIGALKGQREATDRLRQSVMRELGEVRDLIGRGLTPTSRILPLERTLAQIDREQKELETQVLRARQNINTAERATATVRDQRAVSALHELLEAQALMKDTDGRIANAERVLRESAVYASEKAANEAESDTRFAFAIVRVEGGDTHEFEALETTAVLPGDILKVKVVRRVATPAMVRIDTPPARPADEARAKRAADAAR